MLMRIFYSLLAAVLFSLSASATNVITAKELLTQCTNGKKVAVKGQNDAQTAKAIRKAPYTPEDTDTWKDLGSGYYYDQVMFNIYGQGTDLKKGKVVVQQCVEKPGIYRFQDIFYTSTVKKVLTITNNKNRWCYVDATDPEAVSIPTYETGATDMLDGMVYIGTLDNFGGTATGKFDGKRFTFDPLSVVLWYESYPYDKKDSWGYWACYGTNPFTLELPKEVWPKDYSIKLDAQPCVYPGEVNGKSYENLWEVKATVGEDVQSLVVTLWNDMYEVYPEDTTEVLKNCMKIWERKDATEKEITIPLDMTNLKRGLYSVPFVALDVNGNPQTIDVSYMCYDKAHSNESWETMEGQATFLDVFTVDLYEGPSADYKEYSCPVEKDKNNPGSYRLVDPFKEFNAQYNQHTDHTHYMYVHVTDDMEAYIETSPIGADDKGWILISSEAYKDYILVGEDPHNGWYGVSTMGWVGENNDIQFNTWSLYVYSPYIDMWYWANTYDKFYLRIPEIVNGIRDINAEKPTNGVRFNLQGQRVNKAQRGIFIENGKKIIKK